MFSLILLLYQFFFCKFGTGNFLKIEGIFRFIWSGGLNPYDLYRDCHSNTKLNKARIRAMKFGLTSLSFDLFKNNKPTVEQKPLESVLTYLRVSSLSINFLFPV